MNEISTSNAKVSNVGFFVINGEKYFLYNQLAELLGTTARKMTYYGNLGLNEYATNDGKGHYLIRLLDALAWIGDLQHKSIQRGKESRERRHQKSAPERKMYMHLDFTTVKEMFQVEYNVYLQHRYGNAVLPAAQSRKEFAPVQVGHKMSYHNPEQKRKYAHTHYTKSFEKLWQAYLILGGKAEAKQHTFHVYIEYLETKSYKELFAKCKSANVVAEPLYAIILKEMKRNNNL